MGNTHKKGSAQPGVVRSDDYPWGLKNINMPIPLEFARKLRNNTDGLQDEYRKFVVNRVYQMIPAYINCNSDTVHSKFRPSTDEIKLVMWNTESNQKGLGNGDIRELLTPKSRSERLYDIHGFKQLFCNPNILANIPDEEKAEIISQIYTPYWFTDNPYVATIIKSEIMSKHAMFNASNAINAYNQQNWTSMDNLLAGQNNTALFTDNPRDNALREAGGDANPGVFKASIVIFVNHRTAMECQAHNKQVLTNLVHGRNLINVEYSIYNPYQQGEHAISVIIDTDKKLIYLLDSNGIGDGQKTIFHYFAQQLNWQPGEYKVIPIMPYKPDETPRSFQGISRGGFCQTWNIFNQELVMLNDVDTDINKTIYDEILSHVDPIIGDVAGMSVQVKITLIMLEFMFYIFQSCKYEFLSWVTDLDDIDATYDKYVTTNSYWDEYDNMVHNLLSKISDDPNLIHPELITFAENTVKEQLKENLVVILTAIKTTVTDADFHVNPDTSEYISKFYPEYESTKNIPTDHFINNALHTFL